MASMSEIADDFFTCSLCMEKYRDPRTLPCLHTFCRACLFSYMGHTVQGRVFPCPLCGQETHQVGSDLSIEQWMETFPVNSFVVSLQKVSDMRRSEKACDICRQEQVLVQAMYWCKECLEGLCEDCERVHGRIRASREHHVVGIESLENETLEKLLRPRRGHIPCQEHRGKTLSLVCLKCKTMACDTCIAVFHKGCKQVEPCMKIVSDFRNDFCQVEKTLDAYFNTASEISKIEHSTLDRLTKSKEEVISEIKAFGQKLVNEILEKEQRLITQVDSLYTNHRDNMAEQVWNSEVRVNSIAKTKQFIRHLTSYGAETDILNNYEVIAKQMQILKKIISVPMKTNEATVVFKFVPYKKLSDVMRSTVVLGEVVTNKVHKKLNENREYLALPAPQRYSLTPRRMAGPVSRHSVKGSNKKTQPTKSKLVSSFSGRCHTDTMRTDLRGILLLSSGDFVVMDVHFRNKRLKKFGPRGKLISTLDTGECPHSLILVSEFDAIVSLPKSREIAFVAVGGTLQIAGKLKLLKQYYSLASCVGDSFVAVSLSSLAPPTIDVLSFTGEIISSLSLDRVRYPTPPKSIAINHKGEYIILFGGKECVVCLGQKGDMRYHFCPSQVDLVRKEVHIQCDDTGNSYIVDVVSHSVHVISDEGKRKGTLLCRSDGLWEPVAMCLVDRRVAVTQSNGDIKLFTLH